MSKIICDVCGTSYPETATQCPICGCVRPGDAYSVAYDSNESESNSRGTYTYVKGGRFSKSNVKKRNQGVQRVNTESVQNPSEPENREKKNDKGFVIAVVLLLVAIVAVVIYIALRFFGPASMLNNNTTEDTLPSTTEQTSDTSVSTDLEISCDEILLTKTVVEFDRVGAAIFLNVTLDPADTTDTLLFSSSDDNVATVNADGRITAVGAGEAVITVSCGPAEATCQVICNFEVDSTEETVEETTAQNAEGCKLNTENRENDVTIRIGESFVLQLLDANNEAIDVEWSVEDPQICSVSGNTVEGLAEGTTTVSVIYGGKTFSCIVRVY